jgi:hypothetical protein
MEGGYASGLQRPRPRSGAPCRRKRGHSVHGRQQDPAKDGEAMTKSEELAVLDAAIAKLGTESYLGPWLASVRFEVEHSLTSDMPPLIKLGDHIADIARREEEFNKRITERANYAESMMLKCLDAHKKDLRRLTDQAHQALRRALKDVEEL